MRISDEEIINAAHAIAGVDKIEADARAVLEDAYLLSMAFTDRDEYLNAVANTVRALRQLSQGVVSSSQLKCDHADWLSYHYQHKIEQGRRADLRIVFRREGGRIRLRAFGHRNLPKDFYERISQLR
jgi:hypothetical protein